MVPRLLVVCLGGLAGAGAVVCCDLDEGVDETEAASDGEIADAAEGVEPDETPAKPSPVH
jgi:hypothetical protein